MLRAGHSGAKVERILITHLHGDHCYGLFGMLSLIAIHGRIDPVEVVGPHGIAEMLATVLRLSANQLGYRLDVLEVGAGSPPLGRGAWTVSAWPLAHRVPSFGYVLQEVPRPGRFHPDRATALGIPPGPLYRRLQEGHAVTLADGRVVEPLEVCDPPRPGRKLVLLGDTSDSSAIAAAGSGCDLLVHEATYDAGREDKAIQWGHSTTAMAGRFAARIGARTLVITHLSSRYHDGDEGQLGLAELQAEAQAQCPATRVLVADDLVTVEI
jgi:ribonuclease Z